MRIGRTQWSVSASLTVVVAVGCADVFGLTFDGAHLRSADAGLDASGHAGGSGASTGSGGATGSGGLASGGSSSDGSASGGSGGSGPTCLTDLSGVGTGDFRIAFTITTTTTGLTVALLNQRTGCTASMLWDVVLNPSGFILAQIDDGVPSHNVVIESTARVNDGQQHRVVLARMNGQVQCSVDGTSSSAPDPYAYGSFPPLSVGIDLCAQPLAGHGTLTDLCITEGSTSGTDAGMCDAGANCGGGSGGSPSGGSSGSGGSPSSGGSGGNGPACLTDLSGVGAGDFSIHFTLTTTESGLTIGLLNQRTGCDCLSTTTCPQPSTFWDVSLSPTAGIVASTDDGIAAHYVFVEAGDSLNDGKPHKVDVIRRGGMLWYASDGTIHSLQSPDPYMFGTFPPLVLGSSACAGTTPAAGHATTSEVCITEP